MKSFKKMKLVPIDIKQNSDQLLMPPAEKKLVQINDDMQNILSNRTLAKDKKLQLYYHALQNYINLHSKLSMPRRGKHIASYADSTDASSFDLNLLFQVLIHQLYQYLKTIIIIIVQAHPSHVVLIMHFGKMIHIIHFHNLLTQKT